MCLYVFVYHLIQIDFFAHYHTRVFSDNNNKPYLNACFSSHFFVKELGSKFEKRNIMKSSMPACLFGECEFYVFLCGVVLMKEGWLSL